MKLVFSGTKFAATVTNAHGEVIYSFNITDAQVELDLLKLKDEIAAFFIDEPSLGTTTFREFGTFQEAVYAFYADGGHSPERTDELLSKYTFSDLNLLHEQITDEGYHCPLPHTTWIIKSNVPA